MRRILIDGGRPGTYPRLRQLLDQLDDKELELMVVTHVDQDHILGVLAMLEDDTLPVTFKDVWFNGYDELMDNVESFGPQDGKADHRAAGAQVAVECSVRWPQH